MTFDEFWMTCLPAEVDELKSTFKECWDEAQKAEREACVKVCDALGNKVYSGWECADAIHARGKIDER